jgi:hypothetical protein
MGIDYDGGMIVGAIGSAISVPDDSELALYEWAEDQGMESMSQWFDCDDEYKYYGFCVIDTLVSDIKDDGWLDGVRKKAELFEQLTGVPASLIGTQNIW